LEKPEKTLLGQFFGFKIPATNEVVDIVKIALPDGSNIAQFREAQEIYADTLGVTLMAGLVWEHKAHGSLSYTFESKGLAQKNNPIPTVYALEQELIDCIDP